MPVAVLLMGFDLDEGEDGLLEHDVLEDEVFEEDVFEEDVFEDEVFEDEVFEDGVRLDQLVAAKGGDQLCYEADCR